MQSRAEVNTRYAKAYVRASKKDKGRVLDQVVAVTGWSRDNARRRLAAAARQLPGVGRQVAKRPRKPRSSTYSYDAVTVLQRVWAASGGQGGKDLAAVDVPGVRVLESLVGHTAASPCGRGARPGGHVGPPVVDTAIRGGYAVQG